MFNWLIARAKRTPYFHLAGYMNRWWLVPYNKTIVRTINGAEPHIFENLTDGTGMVSLWRRPFTWLIQKLGFAIRVHEILRSDSGREPHNHPWPYLTIILRGGYFEARYDGAGQCLGTEWHGPGSILYRPADSWHRLVLPADVKNCTTLFITGDKCQKWGFLASDGTFTPYDRYPGRNA